MYWSTWQAYKTNVIYLSVNIWNKNICEEMYYGPKIHSAICLPFVYKSFSILNRKHVIVRVKLVRKSWNPRCEVKPLAQNETIFWKLFTAFSFNFKLLFNSISDPDWHLMIDDIVESVWVDSTGWDGLRWLHQEPGSGKPSQNSW